MYQFFTVKYEDNTSEPWYIEYFSDYSSKARIPIGVLGFRFVKTFRGSKIYFSATVIEIIDSGKRVCKSCDGESNHYTLIEVERFSIIQVQNNDEHTSTCTDNDGDYDDDCDDYFNVKSDTSSSDSTPSDQVEEEGGFLEAPMGEQLRNIAGEATKSCKALAVNENVTSASEMQGNFFKKFI